MTDENTDLRRLACLTKHKAHFGLMQGVGGTTTTPCKYCGTIMFGLLNSGEPSFVWYKGQSGKLFQSIKKVRDDGRVHFEWMERGKFTEVSNDVLTRFLADGVR